MKTRQVYFSPEAERDLTQIYDWIADVASLITALNYVSRIKNACRALDLASERGHLRNDIRPNLRIIGFERSATIAFAVSEDRVTILRIFSRGRNWEGELSMPSIKTGNFSEFTKEEIENFKSLVLSEENVNPETLPGLLEKAVRIVTLSESSKIIGTAAIKEPIANHRKTAFERAGVPEREGAHQLELGWIVVEEHHRNQGHSKTLVGAALGDHERTGLYATSRDQAVWMHTTLERFGFRKIGTPYNSNLKPGAKLLLFVK